MRLLGRRHARHVEVRYPQRGRRSAREVVVAPLAAEARHRRRGVREATQQVDGALVPAEVVDRGGDLAALDEVDAVAGQPGEERVLRVDDADVPHARQEQPALGAGTSSSIEPVPPSTGVREAAEQVDGALVPAEVVDRRGDLAVLDEVDAVAGEPGEQRGLRVDNADVPHAGQQEAPLGAGDEVLDRAGGAVHVEDEVVDGGSDRLLGHLGGVPGLAQRRELARADPVGPAELEPVVEDRALVGRRRGEGERRALQSGVRRVGVERHLGPGQLLADPGAGAVPAEDGLAVPGVARAGQPVGVDHQVGHGRRRHDRVVAAGLEVDTALAPGQPLGELLLGGQRVDVAEVAGGAADPGAVGEVRGLAGAREVAGRLDVPEPQPGGRAEVGGGHLVVHEAVEHPARGPGPAERLAQRGRDVVVDLDAGAGRLVGPVGRGAVGDQLLGVLGGRGGPRGRVGAADQLVDLGLGGRAAADRADRDAAGLLDERHDRHVHAVHHAVGGERVVGPPQVGAGRVAHDRHAVVGHRRRERVLDQRLGVDAVRRLGHRPDSWVVLRMRMSRNSAVGQPWLTGATWPGCALPQLEAPPSCQVCGPPTASIAPQKSVVVAW